jgi:hypothetical protein
MMHSCFRMFGIDVWLNTLALCSPQQGHVGLDIEQLCKITVPFALLTAVATHAHMISS